MGANWYEPLYAGYTAEILQNDAQIINKLGLIRGSVQRLANLELMQMEGDELIHQVDELLTDCSVARTLGTSLPDLQTNWEQVKQNTFMYRQNPANEHAVQLVESSEAFWNVSNEAVFSAQRFSEKKLRNFKSLLGLFVITWSLTAWILVWLKRYVRDFLEYLANYDSLTKAANRALYRRVMERECKRARRKNQHLSLVIFDIDHFKEINDTHGHSVGDSVLRSIAGVVKRNIEKNHVFARVGGEEFAVIVPDTSGEEAVQLGERLRKAIERTPMGTAGSVTVSVGVAEFREGDDPITLFERADDALYKAKKHGRNQTEWNGGW